MAADPQQLWERYNPHPGNREGLFGAVAQYTGAQTVLYPGSFIDVAASTAFPEVTYVDVDRRAAAFFADERGVASVLDGLRPRLPDARIRFIAADYRVPLDVEPVDLLVSLYAGPISHYCTEYLRPGGHLLVNPSHGDVTLALADDRYALLAVVNARDGVYRVRTQDLAAFTEVRGATPDTATILESSRGARYRRPASAYLFGRIA